MTHTSKKFRGFTLLEVQVAVVLLAFGVVTLAALSAGESKLLRRMQRGFSPGATVYVTQSADPWVRGINTPARLTTAPITQTAPPINSHPANNVTLIDKQVNLKDESITVTVAVSPAE